MRMRIDVFGPDEDLNRAFSETLEWAHYVSDARANNCAHLSAIILSYAN